MSKTYENLIRRALRLEYATVGWNVAEGAIAVWAGVAAGSVALVGFGLDSFIEVIAAVALIWRLKRGTPEEEAGRSGRPSRSLAGRSSPSLLTSR